MGSSLLTQRQKAILVGSLLGDATVELRWKNARARFAHGVLQKEYLFWKHREFCTIATAEPQFVKQTIHWQTGKIYTNWHFSTKALPELNNYRRLFYQGKKKIVPDNVEKVLIDPLSLAVWIMDDGYKRNDCDAVRISTESFSFEEHRLLIKCLKLNFGLHAATHRKSKWFNLYIPQPEMIRLCMLIGKYIIPSMR
ncbi:MAG: hypothetical protein HYZ69_03025, partial [Candidatus Colwellbacteria bacterium]|nr:hypothetical protein [Candidatus Colwellbacteria bacterium]